MEQNHIYHEIILEISNKETQEHLQKCSSCRTIYSKVDETLSLLDSEVSIPDQLSSNILSHLSETENQKTEKAAKLNFFSYVQILVVIVIGILLGFVLGKNADTSVFQSDKAKFHKSLIEYREMHHLNIDATTFSI